MDIEAVTFDVGGTLIVPWPSVGHVYAEGAAALGLGRFEAEELSERFARAWRAKGRFDYSKGAWARLVGSTFAGLIPVSAREKIFEHLYDAFRDARVWRVQPDVRPAWEGLRARGLRLGIISNWDDRLPPLLEAVGLAGQIDTRVISYEVKAVKPDARLFRLAAERLGLPPERILHVGDSVEEDVRGAEAAGLQALLLDRSGPGGPGQIEALTELLGRVD